MIYDLSPEERTKIFTELITGPRPRSFDPDLKRALLEDLDPSEQEVARDILEIVETGGVSLDDLLAEFDKQIYDNPPPNSNFSA